MKYNQNFLSNLRKKSMLAQAHGIVKAISNFSIVSKPMNLKGIMKGITRHDILKRYFEGAPLCD